MAPALLADLDPAFRPGDGDETGLSWEFRYVEEIVGGRGLCRPPRNGFGDELRAGPGAFGAATTLVGTRCKFGSFLVFWGLMEMKTPPGPDSVDSFSLAAAMPLPIPEILPCQWTG